jgi:hypothetical protein
VRDLNGDLFTDPSVFRQPDRAKGSTALNLNELVFVDGALKHFLVPDKNCTKKNGSVKTLTHNF